MICDFFVEKMFQTRRMIDPKVDVTLVIRRVFNGEGIRLRRSHHFRNVIPKIFHFANNSNYCKLRLFQMEQPFQVVMSLISILESDSAFIFTILACNFVIRFISSETCQSWCVNEATLSSKINQFIDDVENVVISHSL